MQFNPEKTFPDEVIRQIIGINHMTNYFVSLELSPRRGIPENRATISCMLMN